jgi:hypothetical protein
MISFFILPARLNSYPLGWSDDILISPDTAGRRDRPDISADSHNNVWVVWDSTGWGGGYIYYSKCDSLGDCIIPETQVSTSSYSRYCRLETDDSDNVHIIWRELSPQGYGLGYVKLANDGSVIVPARLSVGGQGASNRPFFETAIDRENDLHVIWEEMIGGCEQISYTLLDSLGDTLVSNVRVSVANTGAYFPGIAVDSAGNNHIAYRGDTIPGAGGIRLVYTKSDKSGNVLIPNRIISTGSSPSVVCDKGQNVHIFYTNPEGVGNHIYYVKLSNNGDVLIPPTHLSLPTDTSNNMCHASIDSQQFLHVVWKTSRAQQAAYLLYTKIDTVGHAVVSSIEVVYPPHTFWCIEPCIATDQSDKLHLVWVDGRIDTVQRIFYKRGENKSGVEEHAQLETGYQAGISVLPNPFSQDTKIHFSFPRENEKAKIEIYDISGRKVQEFILDRSEGSVTWQGTDHAGSYLPAGVYFLRCTTKGCATLVKITKL